MAGATAESQALKLCILDVDHAVDGDRQVIRLWCKTKGGRTVLVLDEGFRPYFYVEPKSEAEVPELEKRIAETIIDEKRPETIEVIEKKIFGRPKKLLKVIVSLSVDVPKFREIVKELDGVKNTYEYAISFYRRYLIDKVLVPMQWVEVTGTEPGGEEIGKKAPVADQVIRAREFRPLPKERGYPHMHIMAFDIEVIRERGVEEIVMISMMDNSGFSRAITYGSGKS